MISVCSPTADFGNVRGLDVRLDRRFSNLFSGSVAYTFQVARNNRVRPFTYFNTLARQISTLTAKPHRPRRLSCRPMTTCDA